MSSTPSLTPSRSSSPEPPVQPDHFYGAEEVQYPPSPSSDGKTWLDPEDDPLAHRGIPVFKPSMEEFQDFEAYVTKIECWGSKSGIVKVIPPEEWTNALPPLKEQLSSVKIKSPIEQHMMGHAGLFRQENVEKRRIMSVREWSELCSKPEFRAPGIGNVGLHARASVIPRPIRKGRKKMVDAVNAESAEPGQPDDDHSVQVQIKDEFVDEDHEMGYDDNENQQEHLTITPPMTVAAPATPAAAVEDTVEPDDIDGDIELAENDDGFVQPMDEDAKPKGKPKRVGQTREARQNNLAKRIASDAQFLETFDPHSDWLPPNTKPSDYNFEFCQKLERHYWRNCGLGKEAWYGADTQGSLYTDATKAWNVAHLSSTLSRLLPASDTGLPGVNTPYLYFGMWRATFAWHVEDMDLFSINYIHFGAPKFWYSVPQGRAVALEQTMRGYFPKDTSQCPQFLRHKSFLASPSLLAQSSCRPNTLVQHSGEFVITFPRGYHAGFNLGFNCAESVNFALDSWLELGKKAKACECVNDSVRIDVNQLLRDREFEEIGKNSSNKKRAHKSENRAKAQASRKRKSDTSSNNEASQTKKPRVRPNTNPTSSAVISPHTHPAKHKVTLTLKLGPRPTEPEVFPCCLCVSMSKEGLLRVHDPPLGRKDINDAAGNPLVWMAHEECADVIPETWVDEIETIDATAPNERVIFGVDGIVKDRWNLKCSACSKNRHKAHGAPVQCTKGKCPKAFHVSCARNGAENGIIFTILREVEKEVVLLDTAVSDLKIAGAEQMQVDVTQTAVAAGGISTPAFMMPPAARVLKVIKKVEAQILCTQHNPSIAAAKKASKQDKIRNDLLELPAMARIKIRVSAGVFEVSLVRVVEDTGSVEVLWDRGVKREFKWGSVVFGSTDGPVLQKPSEPAPESQHTVQSIPAVTYAPVATTASVQTQHQRPASNVQAVATPAPMAYLYPTGPGAYAYGNWPYYQQQPLAPQQTQVLPPRSPYVVSDRTAVGPSPYYNPYNYAQVQTQHQQYRSSQLLWQLPYKPRQAEDYQASSQTNSQPQTQPQPVTNTTFDANSADQSTTSPISSSASGASSSAQVSADISALSSLQPDEIAEILRSNADLRDVVWAAFDKQQKATFDGPS